MPVIFDTLAELRGHGFDTVIDVRSPAEFAEDHVPGAISLPVLSDAQRAEVGTLYKQTSPFDARKVGAALVARNAAQHIENELFQYDGGWRPLIYCWRGGQRSGSFTSILQQIGWRADTIKGGYQTYRRLVQKALYEQPLPHKLILLDGNTGTAKTDILALLARRGVQVLDLEGLARHRGSLLGAVEGGQPAQKGFESALISALDKLDPTRPVVVEAESSKIGQLTLPPKLWHIMRTAPRIEITAPLEARAAYLTMAYADVIADPDTLASRLEPLRYFRGHKIVDGWIEQMKAGDFKGLASALMEQHYDPAYAKSRTVHDHEVLDVLRADSLDHAGQDALAAQIEARLSEI
ncbi:tRNA 2-selenouridine(34) synthase MnmH [Flavimaricola marinus]|uniref:tRNA 2-selenouridine synthase n=1 Tax=Flavimaricola marinus TaxID=1819565 RepID=A0A238LBR6_9RHOB|nr:tRNA 2-selenouridine(34) synthase MnmH [Flavimaricola marinus]SMY07003.1 tRNA 2-selenouridine synthase [Flavimaricola marinus]